MNKNITLSVRKKFACIYIIKSAAFGVHLVDTYKVSLHFVYGNLHRPVYNCMRKHTYTGHYTDRIPKVPYTSVYFSVHIEYTGSLYLLIQAISCSVRVPWVPEVFLARFPVSVMSLL